MKKGLIVSIVLILCAITIASAARSSHGDVGLGFQIGQPSGITAKFWLDRTSAVDVTMGWNVYHEWASVQAGYLYHFPLSVTTGWLGAYVGLGGLTGVRGGDGPFEGDFYLAGRIPLGMEYIFNPISFYVEFDALVFLLPGTFFEPAGGIGFRFYF